MIEFKDDEEGIFSARIDSLELRMSPCGSMVHIIDYQDDGEVASELVTGYTSLDEAQRRVRDMFRTNETGVDDEGHHYWPEEARMRFAEEIWGGLTA